MWSKYPEVVNTRYSSRYMVRKSSWRPLRVKGCYLPVIVRLVWRRRSESNRWIKVLQKFTLTVHGGTRKVKQLQGEYFKFFRVLPWSSVDAGIYYNFYYSGIVCLSRSGALLVVLVFYLVHNRRARSTELSSSFSPRTGCSTVAHSS